MAPAGDRNAFASFLLIALGIWLIDSGIQGRHPIATLEAIIQNPAGTRNTLTTSKGTIDLGSGAGAAGTSSAPISGGSPLGNPTSDSSVSSTVGGAALAAAQTKIGQPYKLGAKIGSGSWDCGSLVSWAYSTQMVSVPRYVPAIWAQLHGSKKWVSVSGGIKNTEAGDIVIPYPSLSHVVMAIGDGRSVIEAPHTGAKVRTMGYSADGYPKPFAIFRYVGNTIKTTSNRTVQEAQDYAKSQLHKYGWSPAEMPALITLWNKESGWSWSALNPTSGAFGIPQALPGGKMASAGPDWQNNPDTQIDWGLGYIKDRYGSPSAALAHENKDHWY